MVAAERRSGKPYKPGRRIKYGKAAWLPPARTRVLRRALGIEVVANVGDASDPAMVEAQLDYCYYHGRYDGRVAGPFFCGPKWYRALHVLGFFL